MSTLRGQAIRRGALALGAALALAAAPASAQSYDDEIGIDEEVRTLADDERTLADEIPDVEIPDVRVGQNDAVVEEVEEPPPVAVFEEEPSDEAPALEAEAEETEEAPLVETTVPDDTQVTGSISAIDLDDGTLEVDTDTQGTLRLSADRVRLRQLAPGQSVGLSYVDRADGRWVADLQRLPAPEPSPSTE